ncbi:MAG: anthranilate phosphoribosyltransferase [Opitutales bacterium]|nr:anthranilate phosphoribosyltransferase [Opitutales bacterium]
MALHAYTEKLAAGEDLSPTEAAKAAGLLAEEGLDPEAKKALLIALSKKGETVEEVTAFAQTFRGLARDPGLDSWRERAIDIVGTGGTGFGGYNVSSVAALITAAAGVPVLKHGNRAITSRSGSADFLGALGIPMLTEPDDLRASVEALNFCFFFAPSFHPAFKSIMPVRKALAEEGRRTIFNILGPLINPARPAHQLLGVFHPQWVGPLGDALTALGLRAGVAVSSVLPGGKCVDEFTTAGRNEIRGIGHLAAQPPSGELTDYGLLCCPESDLAGGDAEENLALFERLCTGQAPRGLEDTICLNAGVALYIAGNTTTAQAGIDRAREILRGPALADWIARARAHFQPSAS